MQIISPFAAVEGQRRNRSVMVLMKKKDSKDKQHYGYLSLQIKK
jgi:hypothetical protein